MRYKKYEVRTRLFALRNPQLSTAVRSAFGAVAVAAKVLPAPARLVRRIVKKR